LSNNKDILLSVESLNLSFKSKENFVKVLHDVSFEIEKGQIVGIVGESGSGKTVSGLSIMRLLPDDISHTTGQIIWRQNHESLDLLSLSQDEINKYRGRKISMIFQEPMSSFDPTMRCGKQVDEARITHFPEEKDTVKNRTIQLFKELTLEDTDRIYNSYPHELSGGQLQRVMIAMALINQPDLIIADEPTTALDVTVQKEIIELLKSISEQYKCAILFISHDLALVHELCDVVVVMQKGRVVEQGNCKGIFKNPIHPYTRGLLACRPPTDLRLTRLPLVEEFVNLDEIGQKNLMDSLIETEEEYRNKIEAIHQSDVLVNVQNLSKSYPVEKNWLGRVKKRKMILKDINFNVKAGEVLGLVGESGSGKSTLGKCILNLTEIDSGKVKYKGLTLGDLDREKMRRLRKEIQIIFQDPYSSLNPKIKIGSAIMEPLAAHNLEANAKSRKEKAMHLLEKVGLKPEHFDRYPHQFSGGQRQRIVIARSLILEPKFLVCDESVSALDVSVQAQILNLLNDLKKEMGLSYLFISHDLSVVKHFCDRVMVMQSGKIVEEGDVEAVFHHPKSEYTRSLLDAVPGMA